MNKSSHRVNKPELVTILGRIRSVVQVDTYIHI